MLYTSSKGRKVSNNKPILPVLYNTFTMYHSYIWVKDCEKVKRWLWIRTYGKEMVDYEKNTMLLKIVKDIIVGLLFY